MQARWAAAPEREAHSSHHRARSWHRGRRQTGRHTQGRGRPAAPLGIPRARGTRALWTSQRFMAKDMLIVQVRSPWLRMLRALLLD